jgi:hypothetical protein
MIDPSTLTKGDVGRHVLYHRPFCNQERGVLTSWNSRYVFVRFKGPNGESCQPEDISFELP